MGSGAAGGHRAYGGSVRRCSSRASGLVGRIRPHRHGRGPGNGGGDLRCPSQAVLRSPRRAEVAGVAVSTAGATRRIGRRPGRGAALCRHQNLGAGSVRPSGGGRRFSGAVGFSRGGFPIRRRKGRQLGYVAGLGHRTASRFGPHRCYKPDRGRFRPPTSVAT